jgi:ATP-dependent RNA helicase DDX23/PRP28
MASTVSFDDDEGDDVLDAEDRRALEEALQKRKAAAKPMSLEDKLTQQRAQAAALDRPVFMSRAQREAAAAEEAAEAAEIEALMEEAEAEQRQAYMQRVREQLRMARSSAADDERRRRITSAADASCARPHTSGVGGARGGASGPGSAAASSALAADESGRNKEEVAKEKELQQIRESYLGVKKQKKRSSKISDKFRFTFDWGADEDTSNDLNPLYEKKHEALLLFGRGLRAGIDRREQLTKRDATFSSRYADTQALPALPTAPSDAFRPPQPPPPPYSGGAMLVPPPPPPFTGAMLIPPRM